MKPEEFIRKYGVGKVRDIVEGAPSGFTHIDIYEGVKYFVYCKGESHEDDQNTIAFNPRTRKETKGGFVQNGIRKFGGWYISVSDLKRLVKSLDLINSVHGIDEAKELLREIDSEEWCYNLLTNIPIAVECAPSDDLVIHYAQLKQAIRDHQSIYGGRDA